MPSDAQIALRLFTPKDPPEVYVEGQEGQNNEWKKWIKCNLCEVEVSLGSIDKSKQTRRNLVTHMEKKLRGEATSSSS